MRTRRDDQFREAYRNILVSTLEYIGKDFTKCEICTVTLPKGKYDIHHTKYDGATIYDLQITCHRCNTQPEHKFLK